MERKEIFKKIDSIISTSVNHHNFTLTDDTNPADIEKWDSLANAMIITAVQQEFGIKLKFAELMVWKTIGQFVDIIQKKLNEPTIQR